MHQTDAFKCVFLFCFVFLSLAIKISGGTVAQSVSVHLLDTICHIHKCKEWCKSLLCSCNIRPLWLVRNENSNFVYLLDFATHKSSLLICVSELFSSDIDFRWMCVLVFLYHKVRWHHGFSHSASKAPWVKKKASDTNIKLFSHADPKIFIINGTCGLLHQFASWCSQRWSNILDMHRSISWTDQECVRTHSCYSLYGV